jgi:hypothetical protein
MDYGQLVGFSALYGPLMSLRLRGVTCLLIVALLDATAVAAQAPEPELPLGRRVRIQRDRGTDVIGNLVAARADSLFIELQPLGEVRSVALTRVRGILVSQGVPQPLLLEGVLAGAVVGVALFGVLAGSDQAAAAVVGLALGSFVGGIIGGDIRRERWRRVR